MRQGYLILSQSRLTDIANLQAIPLEWLRKKNDVQFSEILLDEVRTLHSSSLPTLLKCDALYQRYKQTREDLMLLSPLAYWKK